MLNYLTLEISIFLKLIFLVKKGNIVVLMTDLPLLNILTSPIIKIKGGKTINWIQDLFQKLLLELE